MFCAFIGAGLGNSPSLQADQASFYPVPWHLFPLSPWHALYMQDY